MSLKQQISTEGHQNLPGSTGSQDHRTYASIHPITAVQMPAPNLRPAQSGDPLHFGRHSGSDSTNNAHYQPRMIPITHNPRSVPTAGNVMPRLPGVSQSDTKPQGGQVPDGSRVISTPPGARMFMMGSPPTGSFHPTHQPLRATLLPCPPPGKIGGPHGAPPPLGVPPPGTFLPLHQGRASGSGGVVVIPAPGGNSGAAMMRSGSPPPPFFPLGSPPLHNHVSCQPAGVTYGAAGRAPSQHHPAPLNSSINKPILLKGSQEDPGVLIQTGINQPQFHVPSTSERDSPGEAPSCAGNKIASSESPARPAAPPPQTTLDSTTAAEVGDEAVGYLGQSSQQDGQTAASRVIAPPVRVSGAITRGRGMSFEPSNSVSSPAYDGGRPGGDGDHEERCDATGMEASVEVNATGVGRIAVVPTSGSAHVTPAVMGSIPLTQSFEHQPSVTTAVAPHHPAYPVGPHETVGQDVVPTPFSLTGTSRAEVTESTSFDDIVVALLPPPNQTTGVSAAGGSGGSAKGYTSNSGAVGGGTGGARDITLRASREDSPYNPLEGSTFKSEPHHVLAGEAKHASPKMIPPPKPIASGALSAASISSDIEPTPITSSPTPILEDMGGSASPPKARAAVPKVVEGFNATSFLHGVVMAPGHQALTTLEPLLAWVSIEDGGVYPRELIQGYAPVSLINAGAYGVVALVRNRATDVLFALKSMEKAPLIDRQMMAQLHAEIASLSGATSLPSYQNLPSGTPPSSHAVSDYVVKMEAHYETASHIFMVLEYCDRGPLLVYIHTCSIEGCLNSAPLPAPYPPARSLPEWLVGWYVGQVTSGTYALHAAGWAHRDLKPENFLLNRGPFPITPQLRVADTGWAQRLDAVATTPCGTLEYQSPEIIFCTGQQPPAVYHASGETGGNAPLPPGTFWYTGAPADAWAIGVFCYELLTGYTPAAVLLGAFNSPPTAQMLSGPVPPPALAPKTPVMPNDDVTLKYIMSSFMPSSLVQLLFTSPFAQGKVSPQAADFISRLLDFNPQSRMTVKDALDHAWLRLWFSDRIARGWGPADTGDSSVDCINRRFLPLDHKATFRDVFPQQPPLPVPSTQSAIQPPPITGETAATRNGAIAGASCAPSVPQSADVANVSRTPAPPSTVLNIEPCAVSPPRELGACSPTSIVPPDEAAEDGGRPLGPMPTLNPAHHAQSLSTQVVNRSTGEKQQSAVVGSFTTPFTPTIEPTPQNEVSIASSGRSPGGPAPQRASRESPSRGEAPTLDDESLPVDRAIKSGGFSPTMFVLASAEDESFYPASAESVLPLSVDIVSLELERKFVSDLESKSDVKKGCVDTEVPLLPSGHASSPLVAPTRMLPHPPVTLTNGSLGQPPSTYTGDAATAASIPSLPPEILTAPTNQPTFNAAALRSGARVVLGSPKSPTIIVGGAPLGAINSDATNRQHMPAGSSRCGSPRVISLVIGANGSHAVPSVTPSTGEGSTGELSSGI